MVNRTSALATGWGVSSLAILHVPLWNLLSLALRDDRYSYLLLVPFISAFLMWLRREDLLRQARISPATGIPVIAIGLLIATAAGDQLRIQIFGAIVSWVGIALLCCGPRAVRAASFPLLFLFLMIPLPMSLMEQFNAVLQ